MAKTLISFSTWFWNDDFWLPPNITWQDIKSDSSSKINYANFDHLYVYPWILVVCIFIHRYLLEGCFFRYIGRRFGIKGHPNFKNSLQLDKKTEKEFKAIKKWDQKQILKLSQKLDVPERKVQQLLRQRQILSRPSQLDKFAESGWRWTSYTFLFLYGATVLSNKTWLWKVVDCWVNYPHHNLENDIWWYYMLELSLNLSLAISILIFDIRRKDFFMMLFHHLMTVLLISLSWTLNFFKVGTLVMLCHDAADVWLESAKMCRYAGYRKASEILFAFFALSWIVLRLGYYPTIVLHSITVEAPQIVQYFGAYHIFMIMLSLLLVLNIQWSYFIMKVAYVALYTPKGVEDARSDSDSDDVDDQFQVDCSLSDSNEDSAEEIKKDQ